MAASTATAHFSAKQYVPLTSTMTLIKGSTTLGSCFLANIAAGKRCCVRRLHIVRNSGSEVSAETAENQEDSEAQIEVQKDASSLISALNVEKALRGIAITDVDHYGRLGVSKGCSYDQVKLSYKIKVDELFSRGLEEEDMNKNLELLKESYDILSSVEERRFYDWSLARNEKPDQYVWPFEVDITQGPFTDALPPQILFVPNVFQLSFLWLLALAHSISLYVCLIIN